MEKWKIQDLGKVLGSSLKAILRGEFLLRLNVGRYFVHIVYTFFLMAMVIWISLAIDTTMLKVEKNKAEITELTIARDQKTYDLVKLTGRSSVRKILENMGSAVTEPSKPATVLSK